MDVAPDPPDEVSSRRAARRAGAPSAGPRRSGSRLVVRRAIARAAAELFIERGFDNVTVSEIAEHVGIARRTFFLHFASKDDPLIAWLDEEWHRATATLLDQPVHTTPMTCYVAALRGLAQHFDQDRETTGAITRIILATPTLFGRQYARQFEWASRWAVQLRQHHGRPANEAMAYEVDAAAAFSVLPIAAQRWVDDARERPFRVWLDRGFARLDHPSARSQQPS